MAAEAHQPRGRGWVADLLAGATLLPLLALAVGLLVSGLLPAVSAGLVLFLPVVIPVVLLALAACGGRSLAVSASR
jgi:hypothetical protein